MKEAAHYSPFAGSWYPADCSELRELLSNLFRQSRDRTGPITRSGGVAFVVPHAGLQFSGVVAASAYRHIEGTGATRVILLGFSHRRGFSGIAIPEISEYATPLGAMPFDGQSAEALEKSPPFWAGPEHELCDHSVEIQLPLLQSVAPAARVLPLYVGDLTRDERERAGDTLRSLLDVRTVLIASTDFTHYGRDFGYVPFPADRHAPERLRSLDESLMTAANTLDADLFIEELIRSRSTLCGFDPVCLMLTVLRGLDPGVHQATLDYNTSGAITKDYRHSVSYAALGYFPPEV